MHRIKLYDLKFIHPFLRGIMHDIEKKFGPQDITSLFRMHDPGVHGTLPLRGIDFSVNDQSVEIRDYINSKYEYDPLRENIYVCIYGDNDPKGNHDDHVHLQVHDRSALRK